METLSKEVSAKPGEAVVFRRKTTSFDLNQYSEFRAYIVAEQANRLIRSKSWQLTDGLRKCKAMAKSLHRAYLVFTSRALNNNENNYDQLLAKAASLIVQSGLFDEHYYQRQLDLRGIKTSDCLFHFIKTGWRLGLNPNCFFDCDYYRSKAMLANAEVKINPLLHYILEGVKLRLATSKYFDTAFYLTNYPEVTRSGLNPLTHFLHFGILENRIPVLAAAHQSALGADKAFNTTANANRGNFPDQLRTYPHPTGNFDKTQDAAAKKYDLVLCAHAASRTGAPMLALAILKHFKAIGLNVLLVLLEDGELLPEFLSLAEVINLSETAEIEIGLNNLLERLEEEGRLDKQTPVILNSAETLDLSRIFHRRSFKVTTLVHEFLTSYSEAHQRHLLENSDTVVFSSRTTQEASLYQQEYNCKTTIIPQGLLDPSFLNLNKVSGKEFLNTHLNITPNTFVVLACGSAEHRKGLDLFIQTAITLLSEPDSNKDVTFIWVGDPLPHSEDFLTKAKDDLSRSGFIDRVHILPSQQDITPYFAGADLFLLPSRQDPLPCVLHLAMAARLPVIAFKKSGGAAEVLSQGGGTLLDYANVSQVAQAIETYRQNHQLRIQTGESARSIVVNRYKMSDYVNSLMETVGLTPQAAHSVTDVQEHYETFNEIYQEAYGDTLQAYGPSDTKKMLAFQSEFARLDDGMRVLDAGCGICGPSIYFAKTKNVIIDALTISTKQKESAERLIAQNSLTDRITVKVGDFHYLPELYEPNTFDRVFFLESICHSRSFYEVLRGAHHVLKKDGILFIKDYTMHNWLGDESKHQQQQALANLSYKEYNYQLLYLQQLERLLKLSGFKILELLSNAHSGEEDPTAQLNFEEAAGLTWRKGVDAFHIADNIMIIATPQKAENRDD